MRDRQGRADRDRGVQREMRRLEREDKETEKRKTEMREK